PLFELFRGGERALADLLVTTQVEKGVLKDRADHPHEVHLGRPGEPENLPGGSRRDQASISVDDVEPAVRGHRVVQKPFGLAGDERAPAGEVDRGDGGVKLRPFNRHLRATVEAEHERAVHFLDAPAIDRRDTKIEIAPKNILNVIPATCERKPSDSNDT